MSANTVSHFEDIGGHESSGNVGYTEILKHADPDTEWERIGKWALRARSEGVLDA